MNLQVLDLKPNTSLKNSVLDGNGQTFYIDSMDWFGATTDQNDSFKSGSRNTDFATASNYDCTAQDTTGGGNDCFATARASFGLAAYLREMVQPGGIILATAGRMTPANAILQARALAALVESGGNLTAAGINTVLCNVGVGGTANTDLTGAAGFSRSHGTVDDILRIMSGETWVCPRYVIVANAANQFLTAASRATLVTAQKPWVTGKTFVASGHWATTTEPGHKEIPMLAYGGAVNASYHAGYLFKLAANVTFLNPNKAYTAGDVSQERPRAVRMSGAAIAATGTAPVVRVYDYDGTCLL
jgi:hypothetical protein